MATPNLKVYYWGYVSGAWKWVPAAFFMNGTLWYSDGSDYADASQLDPANGFTPIRFPGPAGGGFNPYSDPTMVADSIYSGDLVPWSTTPVVILNEGDASLEDMNIAMAPHFWATPSDDGNMGFTTWWTVYKNLFQQSDPNLFQANNYGRARTDWYTGSIANTVGSLGFFNGWRVPPATTTEDATGSLWASQGSNKMWQENQMGLGFVRNDAYIPPNILYGYGEEILSTIPATDGDRLSAFGNPTSPSKGWFAGNNLFNASNTPLGTFTGNECVISSFTPLADYTITDKNAPNVWRMAHVWKYANRKINAHGFRTMTTDNGAEYQFRNSNSDVLAPKQLLRCYAYASLYFNAPSEGTPMTLGDNEGVLYGRYFATLAITGRYYNV